MTRDEALQATRDALIAAEELAALVERLRGTLGDRLPPDITADVVEDATLAQLHALLHMFEQLHDLIGRRLFRGALLVVEEDAAVLSAKALTLRLEQLGAIPSRADWNRLTEVRNVLVHDYPVTTKAFLQHVALADVSFDPLFRQLRSVAAYLRTEGLFE